MSWQPAASGVAEADVAARGSGIKLAAELSGRVLSLAASYLLAVSLGVEGFGTFAAASGIAVVLAEAADLGLQGTAIRALVARTMGLSSMLRAKLLLTVLVGAGALGWLAVSPALGDVTANLALPLLCPLILYYVLAGWSELLGVALRARGRRGEEAAVLLALRAGTLVGVLAALRAGADLSGIAWAHALSTLPSLCIALPLTRRVYGRGLESAAPQPPALRVLRTALPLAVNGGLALLSLRLELLVVYFTRGSVESGLFGAALKVIESLAGIPNAVTAGAMPSLTRDALQTMAAVRERVSGIMAMLAVPAGVGLALLAPAVVSLLGSEYDGASRPLAVLALALVPLFMNTVLLHGLIAAGHASRLPRLTGARVGAAAVLAAALIPAFGAIGAATGFLGSELVLMLLAARACGAVGFAVPLAVPLAVAVGLTPPMALVVALAGRRLVVSVALGVLTYAATLGAAWRFKPELLRFLREARR